MKGACIIDGVDIDDYGMFILRGGDYDFLSFPDRKPPLTEDWYEHNGVDADLSEIYFQAKSVTMSFYIKAETGTQLVSNWARFRAVVTRSGYREVYIRDLDRTFRLRYVSCPEYEHHGGLAKPGKKWSTLTINFSQDDPLQLFTNPDITSPVVEYPNRAYVTLDGRDLGEYGILVRECYSSMLAAPAIKEPLTREFERQNGLLVYPSPISTFDVKQVTVGCTMRATSMANFYRNYEALFNAVSAKRELLLSSYAGEDRCFYTRMVNFIKMRPFNTRILVKFDLVFTCLDTGLLDFLLASEDGRYIVTEDGMHFIDMNYYG